MAGKDSTREPNLAEIMIASQILSDLRIHDNQAHKIIADGIVKRLNEQRAGIANFLVAAVEGLKIEGEPRTKLLRIVDLIRRGTELHWKNDDDDIRPAIGLEAPSEHQP